MIAVSTEGENFIVINAGANAALTARHVRLHREMIVSAGVVVLQWEVPLPTILEAMTIANRAGVPVIFTPTPMRPGFPWGKVRIGVLIVNEGEARELFGAGALKRDRASWQAKLSTHGAERIVITRGARPTIAITPDGYSEVPVLPITPVDTVGAGDAFAGTLASRLAEGTDFAAAVAAANCAGGLATLKPGAQEAIPTRRATDRTLHRLPPR
jgi:ribokinase